MPTRAPRFVRTMRADNSGPMTLDGTRSYLLGVASPTAGVVVVDPGPRDEGHVRALADAGPVGLVLVTHRHADHTAGSARLRDLTGAPVRAADPAHCHGGPPLRDGEVIEAAGLRIEVVATPGHTADSVCFLVTPDDGDDGRATDDGDGDRDEPVMLTGDTVLGAGTTVIAGPDGSLADYLASLDRIERLTASAPRGTLRGLPGHGPAVDDLTATVRAYRTHRLDRLAQVRAALADLGPQATPEQVVRAVYADVDPAVLPAARQSLAAQLAYLRDARRPGTLGGGPAVGR